MTLRQSIIQRANERGFVLVIDEEEYPAVMSGALLDFPVVFVKGKEWAGVSCEISWHLAERLANGTSKRVVF